MSLRNLSTVGLLLVILVSATPFMGCKIGSSDSVSRHVGIHVAGLYRSSSGRIVSSNTGAPITQLNVIQDGNRLQAIDNNGMIFKGSIGNAADGSASFNLKGRTTAGAEGILSGAITVNGTTAVMRGTWAEPTLYGNVAGTATVEPTPTPPSNGDNGNDNNNDNGNGNDNGNENGNGDDDGNGNGNGDDNGGGGNGPPLPPGS